jgi:hypothetical protein
LGAQGHAGVKADPDRARQQRVLTETVILSGVFYHQHAFTQIGVGAERNFPRRLVLGDARFRQARPGQEPLPVQIYQRDQRHGYVADTSRPFYNLAEGLRG